MGGLVFSILLLIGHGLDPSVVHAGDFTKDDLKVMAVAIATEHNLNAEKFLKTIECESGWNPKAKGDYRNGKPTSFGLVQLRFPETDWGLTKAQAMQPLVAMTTMAEAWQKGLAKKWSCFPGGGVSPPTELET